ncbi:hypothetical protein FIA58_002495 [Flavobacterium jejuense]|uniref:Reverse transcriptase domain-containing protein n=1 Tax=Flavobacterium jejuense TaxID=1544455 RepID=A0ABX0IRM5_9FLAO|nr:RNA-directed DNA polymerase [Flavobacterium jejuense]NHN24534.1 hypothetical protein [Flavobacterium jejuense]
MKKDLNLQSDLEFAYRKLKSFIYHESFSLDLRMEISTFEQSKVDSKIKELQKNIEKYISDESCEELLKDIGYSVFPKRMSKKSTDNFTSFYFSNSNLQESYTTTKITPFIKCPVEIHILSVLWIMKIGYKLDEKLSVNCFGNRLFRSSNGKFDNSKIHLFQKYYQKYNKWRDEAVKKSKELHSQKYDVAILNLDIKEYYNSINFDFCSIENFVDEEYKWLNNLIAKIHKSYIEILNKDEILLVKNKLLPIGLLSSSVIANHILAEFDKAIESKIKPQYYGRYVDDILIVIANPQIDKNDKDPVKNFIKKYLINQSCWGENVSVKEKDEGKEYEILLKNDTLIFQDEKIKLYHILANESIEILNRFESEIIKNSSEFRFQPEAEQIFESFNADSYEIVYSDTVNKIRSIDGIKTNKLGASKHLRKLISATQNTKKLDSKSLDDISQKILDYFSGIRSIELNLLWEKVVTFFVINKAEKSLIEFIKAQSSVIDKIIVSENHIKGNKEKIKDSIQKTLRNHLHFSIAMSSTLDRKFFKDKIIKQFSKDLTNNDIESYLEKISNTAQKLLESNMFRQHYSFFPLLSYCKQHDDFSYTDQFIKDDTSFSIDKQKIKYSPRFIHYHELIYFHYLKRWNSGDLDKVFNVEKIALENYIEFNTLDDDKGYSKGYPNLNSIVKDKNIKSITISKNSNIDNLKIAIANIVVKEDNSINSMLNKPNLSFERLNQLNIILNEALRNNCDVIIFPEICIPYQWISILTSFARKNEIAVIAGVEHFTRKNKVYNFMLTALPFKFDVYNNLFIDFRLKKDYSPSEIKEIIGRNEFKLPTKNEMQYEKLRLYQWRGLLFSTFNCFELCDIEKRSKFRGNVDFLVAIEHNRDIEYFSNIVESISRDIHTYIIQVNTSQYGDSRINQPSESYTKDIVKIKGGENVSILTAKIDIKKLREFQTYNYILQDTRKMFKATPPNFIINQYRKKY